MPGYQSFGRAAVNRVTGRNRLRALGLVVLLSVWLWAQPTPFQEIAQHAQEVHVLRQGVTIYDFRRDHQPTTGSNGGPYDYRDSSWHPYHQNLHTLQSMSKSITAALVGIALERGELDGLDTRGSDFFPGWQGDATLQDLLTMRAGIQWDEDTPYLDPRNDWAGLERSPDWLRYILAKPLQSKTFCYNSGVTVMLAEALRQATGMQVDDYARERLFKPLGIRSYYWKRTPTGLPDTQGGLYLSAKDVARFGQLYLQDGKWEGHRLLSEGWVAESVKAHVEVPDGGGWKYGYHWWLVPDSQGRLAWCALGYGGQRLIVVPEQELVVAILAWNPDGPKGMTLTEILDRLRK